MVQQIRLLWLGNDNNEMKNGEKNLYYSQKFLKTRVYKRSSPNCDSL